MLFVQESLKFSQPFMLRSDGNNLGEKYYCYVHVDVMSLKPSEGCTFDSVVADINNWYMYNVHLIKCVIQQKA